MNSSQNKNRNDLFPVETLQADFSPEKKNIIGIVHLTWPILLENLSRIALSSVDVFMLSAFSEKAVAAVGLFNQFAFLLQIIYLMVASGASILISQNLGAKRCKDAGLIGSGSILLGLVFAVTISTFICCTANQILCFYKLEHDVHQYAWQFMMIYSGGSIFVAFSIIQSTILRSYGYSREPMVISFIAIIVNVVGNYISIYAPFGLPVFGVPGVAFSTVLSQVVACLIMFLRIRKHKDIEIPLRKIFKVPYSVYRQILSIGIPTAGEQLSYNLGQIVIMRMVSSIGTEAMAATVYAMTLLRFVFINSISIGIGTQIRVGHLVGAGRADEAYRKVYWYFLTGFIMSLVMVVLINIIQVPILSIFTKNQDITHLISIILIVAIVHEPARNFNVIIIPALKGAGDVRFPVYMGMIFMWGIGVLFAYILGIKLQWGLVGIWIGMTADEWIRGLVIFYRWHTGGWRNRELVKIAPVAVLE